MDAYLEFLNENANRRYPLAENSLATSNLGWQIPNNLILDAQVVSRYPVGVLYVSEWNSGTNTLTLASTKYLGFRLQFTLTADYPQKATATVTDSAYPAVSAVSGTLVMGPAVTAMPSGVHLFGSTATALEAIVVTDLSDSLVNVLGGIRADNPDFVVQGDIQVGGGYYTRATQDTSGVITVTTDPLGGQLGPLTTTGDAVCGGVLFTINGQSPGSRGQVQFVPGAGITITAVPTSNKVVIAIDTTTVAGSGCTS